MVVSRKCEDNSIAGRILRFIHLLAFIALFLVVIFLVIVGIIVAVSKFLDLYHVEENDENSSSTEPEQHKSQLYKFLEFSCEDESVSRSLLRVPNGIEFSKDHSFKTFEDEKGHVSMISKFGTKETDYQCSGTCYCNEEDRRNAITGMRKSVYYLLSAATSVLAYSTSRNYFEEKCHSELSNVCSDVVSEVEKCEDISTSSEEEESSSEEDQKESKEEHSILFVCYGNLCRSPMCECIFNRLSKKTEWNVDSCGARPKTPGKITDLRAMTVLKRHFGEDLPFVHYSRKITKEDFFKFEYIVCMDDMNYNDCKKIYDEIDFGGKRKPKLKKLAEYSDVVDVIDDPYFGTIDGFERVFMECTDCCASLIREAEGSS